MSTPSMSTSHLDPSNGNDSLRLPFESPIDRARRTTLLSSGFVYAGLFLWLSVRAQVSGEPEVAVCNALGVVLAIVGIGCYLRGYAMWPVLVAGCIYYPVLSAGLSYVGYAQGSTVVWLILVPPLTFASMGPRVGAVMTLGVLPLLVMALIGSDTVSQAGFSDAFRTRLIACYLILGAISMVWAMFAERYARELMQARDRIASLEELLPMCMYCKKVRVGGEWDHLENYIERQSGALISHGLCNTCFDGQMNSVSRRAGLQSPPGSSRVSPDISPERNPSR